MMLETHYYRSPLRAVAYRGRNFPLKSQGFDFFKIFDPLEISNHFSFEKISSLITKIPNYGRN